MHILSEIHKKCNRCGDTKHIDLFHQDNSTADGKKSLCRSCTNASKHRWRCKNRDKVLQQKRESYQRNIEKHRERYREMTKLATRRYRLREYGTTQEQVEKMLDDQHGMCDICCRKPEDIASHRSGTLFIDHCHKGKFARGLLCQNCNAGIGCFEDSVELLSAAIDYLSGVRG